MAVRAAQPTINRREPRIIERPRLIKLLDETDARTILLLAPAGYGKTTLARQWAKTLNGAVWVTLSAAHADVAWLAEDIAKAIDGKGGAATRAIREHIRAKRNPQRASRELGAVLAERFGALGAQWILLDDYHEVTCSPEAESLIATVERDGGARVLVASRLRPRWASGRRFVYGEVLEVGRTELAMTESEAAAVLGTRPSAAHFSAQAEGWPAVIGLAAAADSAVMPRSTVPGGLHRYLAEELFHRASSDLQEGLLALALRGTRRDEPIESTLGPRASSLLAEAERLGFNSSETRFELHPLLREFLLEKLLLLPDAVERVRKAVEVSVADEIWDHALALVLRFELLDLVEPTVASAFRPLARSGRLATLTAFANAILSRTTARTPSIDVILAEAAFRDGNFDLAMDLVGTLRTALPPNDPISSRAAAISGQISFLQADFSSAEASFRRAGESAADERDAAEAAYGLATASIFGEKEAAATAVDALRETCGRSPVDLLRFVSSEIALRLLGRTADGLSGNLHLDATLQALPHVEDPGARSNAAYTVASALTLRADYDSARDWLNRFFADAEEFGLEFAMPYANWTLAQIAIGQRRFGEAERAMQSIEDTAARTREHHHALNARALRARLLLQNGDADAALRCVAADPTVPLIPSWKGEYLATRALAAACLGATEASRQAATHARATSSALQVRGLLQVAAAVTSLNGAREVKRPISQLIETAHRLDTWDPIVCALRSAPALGDAIASCEELRPQLEALYQRIGDLTLARRAGFRTRATAAPRDVLSPREFEVLGLIACGYKNRDMSRALFIADSTTKVHVRHVLEKLGVRTRAEAVARLKMFDD